MKLTQEIYGSEHRIRSFEAGRVTINNEVFTESVVVTANTLVRDWPPQVLADLTQEHLDAIIALDPEVVLLGTGVRQQFPDVALLRHLIARGIGVEVMDTGAACRTYNVLASEEGRVAAALLLR